MSGRCTRRKKMMGRGVEGGCGTGEKTCPVSRVSNRSSASPPPPKEAAGVDPYTQARKALCVRSPFETEEALARVPTLPVGLSPLSTRYSESRKRHHKKAHADPATGASDVWVRTEEYFRPLTLADIDRLVPSFPSVSDPCLAIPRFPDSVEAKFEEEPDVPTAATEVILEEKVQPMVEEAVEKCEEDDSSSSLNWVLGCKDRVLLTTENPTKKRKKLAGDAALERLLVLPVLPKREGKIICDACYLGDGKLLICSSCNVAVHPKCYGVREVFKGAWFCKWCERSDNQSLGLDGRPCSLCPKGGGALKPVESSGSKRGGVGKFAHLFCCQWMPEVFVEDMEVMEPIMNLGGIAEMRKKLVCNVCKVKYGACIRCSHGTCRAAFHPLCAREAKHRMEIWGSHASDYVELRAFCSKHSNVQDNSNSEHSGGLTNVVLDDGHLVSKHSHDPVPNSVPDIKYGRKAKDKVIKKEKTKNSVADNGSLTNMLAESVIGNRSGCNEAQLHGKTDNTGPLEGHNAEDVNPSDIVNPLLVLKKLIDCGKITIADIASDMGVPSESLSTAFLGDPISLSSELRLKVREWLRKSLHMVSSSQHLKYSSRSSNSKLAEPSCDLAAKAADSYGPNDVKASDLDVAVDDFVRSMPPRRRTKSNIRILKDNKIICSSVDTFGHQKDNQNISEKISEPVLSKDTKKNGVTNGRGIHVPDSCLQEVAEGISVEPTAYPDTTSQSVDLPQYEGNVSEENCVSEMPHKMQPVTERLLHVDQAHDAETEGHGTSVVTGQENTPHAVSHFIASNIKIGGSFSDTFIHPFIKKKALKLESLVFHRGDRILGSDGQREKGNHYFRTTCDDQPLHATSSDSEQISDNLKIEQLVRAKNLGILEHTPEDEVEGEIAYFQNRLLDNALASNYLLEKLVLKVVESLPQELDSLSKQRWDTVFVNQFFREVREAKKQGQREKRHKEAQAVLAAAAAAAATSSRNSSFRRDGHDDGAHVHTESPQKLSNVSGREGSHTQLLPRPKATLSRLAVPKISLEKHSESKKSKQNVWSCDICRRAESILNRIIVCHGCKVSVHLDCYRWQKTSVGPWNCELCEELILQTSSPKIPPGNVLEKPLVTQCGLCYGTSGAFRKTTDGQWVHAFCAEWVLESTYRRGQSNPVDGVDAILKEKDSVICCICHQRIGVCIKCNDEHCQSAFHPTCARDAGLYMNVRTFGGGFQHKAYCEKHSLEQREKVETQKHSPEEVRNIKQIRVELERVRLLCERIIKREKLKRELMLCSHDILASKRDTVAFSVLVHSSFLPPSGSSESATTSLRCHTSDYRSCSEARQRSDDITVDSTLSRKRMVPRLSRSDIDRKTDDSSTSPYTQNPIDRALPTGKQLPLGPSSIKFRHPAENGERKFKSRKQMETFQKELVMTSDQASMQNQRLPKGFVYVPIDSLAKEKSASFDNESHEPGDPDG